MSHDTEMGPIPILIPGIFTHNIPGDQTDTDTGIPILGISGTLVVSTVVFTHVLYTLTVTVQLSHNQHQSIESIQGTPHTNHTSHITQTKLNVELVFPD